MSIRHLVPLTLGSRTSPFIRTDHPFSALQRDIGQLFSELSSGGSLFSSDLAQRGIAGFLPKVDVIDHENRLEVTAELPGLDEKDIQLHLTRDGLVLKGEKRQEETRKEAKGATYVERTYGSFERLIPVEIDIDEDKIDASFKNGILTINLPKTPAEQKGARTINVKKM